MLSPATARSSARPGRKIPHLAAPTIAAAAVLLLTGCSADTFGPQYAVLDQPAQPEDALPAEASASSLADDADTASARYIGEYDGDRLWLLRGTEDRTVCLLVIDDAAQPLMGCGGLRGATVSSATASFAVVPDGADGPSNATRLSENVYAF